MSFSSLASRNSPIIGFVCVPATDPPTFFLSPVSRASLTHMHLPHSAGSLRDPLHLSGVHVCTAVSSQGLCPPPSTCLRLPGLSAPFPFAVETLKIVSWGSDMVHLTCFFHFTRWPVSERPLFPECSLHHHHLPPHPTPGSKHGSCYSILARSRSFI